MHAPDCPEQQSAKIYELKHQSPRNQDIQEVPPVLHRCESNREIHENEESCTCVPLQAAQVASLEATVKSPSLARMAAAPDVGARELERQLKRLATDMRIVKVSNGAPIVLILLRCVDLT